MRLLSTFLVVLGVVCLAGSAIAQTPVPPAAPAGSPAPAAPPAAASSSAATAPDKAALPPSPVQIDNCRLEYNVGGGGLGLLGALGAMSKSTGQLKIKFTNESDREMTVIRFGVDLDGKTANIRDVGKFAPGITVDHGFKDFAGSTQFVFSRQPHPTCHVTYVKYTDGSVWSLPDAPPEPSPSPSADSSAAPAPGSPAVPAPAASPRP